MECNIIDIVIRVKSDDVTRLALDLNNLGAAAFAAACRNAACPDPARVCNKCLARDECAWQLVFGQELAADPAALRRHQKPPLPFVFTFPLAEPKSESGSCLACRLVVIGSAISCLGLLLKGFAALLSSDLCHVPGEIERIYSRDYQGTLHPLGSDDRCTNSKNLVVLSATGIMDSRPWSLNQLELRLHSPLKLQRESRQLRRFEFGFFARSLLRRVSSLVYYYERYEFGVDFRELLRQADAVVCNAGNFRYESEPWGHRKLAGILGYGRFTGDFSCLLPFLVMGSYLHLGKSASFGMGNYAIVSDPGDSGCS